MKCVEYMIGNIKGSNGELSIVTFSTNNIGETVDVWYNHETMTIHSVALNDGFGDRLKFYKKIPKWLTVGFNEWVERHDW